VANTTWQLQATEVNGFVPAGVSVTAYFGADGSMTGLNFGFLLAGAVLTETVFAWPGVGKWLYDGVVKRDYMVIQGGTLLVASTFVIVNMIVDVLYAIINPRISVK
jgi:ABC-type dipeptide/oligopeptide/nickel transport system permease component